MSITFFVDNNEQFELQVSNSNASTIMNALGLNFEYYGQIHPQRLLKAIESTPVELMQRQTISEIGEKGCLCIDCGIKKEQAEYYFNTLSEMAQIAAKSENMIYWG